MLIPKPTPQSLSTPAGQPDIARRIGTQGSFKAAMLRGLRSRHRPGLAGFQTASDEDWSIAFLDAWASVLDNLSFYNERIANEAYLGTATELFSVQELAAQVGYTLAPATAAEAYLAFIADESVLSVGVSELAAPIGVKSIPEEGEQPQTFETVAPLRLKSAWNEMRPLRRWPQSVSVRSAGFYLGGNGSRPRAGTWLAYLGADNRPVRRFRQYLHAVSAVEKGENGLEWVALQAGAMPASLPVSSIGNLSEAPEAAVLLGESLSGFNADMQAQQWPRSKVLDGIKALGAEAADIETTLSHIPRSQSSLRPIMFTETCRVFGHNAVIDRAGKTITPAPSTLKQAYEAVSPAANEDAPDADSMTIYLDRKYERITAGSLLMMRVKQHNSSRSRATELWAYAEAVDTISIEAFGLSGEVTRLRVPLVWAGRAIDEMTLRKTAIYAVPEPVALAALPCVDAVEGDSLLLDHPDLDIAPGQSLILSGERADMAGVEAAERAEVAEVWVNGSTLRVGLKAPLTHAYLRESVRINANVARATHGATVSEILGSGDGRRAFQSFPLKSAPLTYVSAEGPEGRAAALEVLVDGVRWQPVRALDEAGKGARVYTVETTVDGRSFITFGNGEMGARLPTGENNVMANYRKGSGGQGRVRAGQLSLMVSKPRSLSSVRNPLAATGGSDAERLEEARANAPQKMKTIGRVVSLRDFEDFARSFAGITKAKAAWSWVGAAQRVFLTVSGEDEAPLPLDTGVLPNLRAALGSLSAPGTGFTLQAARIARFGLQAKLLIAPDYVASDGNADAVFEAARAALRAAYAYSARGLGQPVRASEIVALLQAVAGVQAVDLDALHRSDAPAGLQDVLRADVPRTGVQGELIGAEILLLSPDPVQLERM